jgi:lactam utilization protein B
VHPSYRDRQGFGGRDREIDSATLRIEMLEQVNAHTIAASAAGTQGGTSSRKTLSG